MDSDIYEYDSGSGDYTKCITNYFKEQISSAVGITRSKLVVAMTSYAKFNLYAWMPLERTYQELQRAKLSNHGEIFLTNLRLNIYSSKH